MSQLEVCQTCGFVLNEERRCGYLGGPPEGVECDVVPVYATVQHRQDIEEALSIHAYGPRPHWRGEPPRKPVRHRLVNAQLILTWEDK